MDEWESTKAHTRKVPRAYTLANRRILHVASFRMPTRPLPLAEAQPGNPQETCDSLPYGNGESCPPTPTEHLFTGKERDSESGNDYFGARYYASTMGRFLSPDWSAGAVPIPYAKLDDPQSMNLYSYVQNMPLSAIDPDGHDCMLDGAPTSQDICERLVNEGVANIESVSSGGLTTSYHTVISYTVDESSVIGANGQIADQVMAALAEFDCDITNPACSFLSEELSNTAPNNGTQTPWYKTCGAQALGSFALHGGLDALAAIPGLGTGAAATQVAISVFNTDWSASGTAGQLGRGLATAGGVNGFVGAIPYVAESGSKVAEAIPGVGIFVGVASVGLDAYNAVQEYRSGCVGH